MPLDALINIEIIIILLGIVFQDLRERKVYLWLFILAGILIGVIHFKEVLLEQFLVSAIINCCVILTIIGILFMYSKIVLKKSLKDSFGLGDFLFFIVLAIGFPTVTFLILFSFSLVFSLLLYLVLKKKLKYQSVPLAGFQALFICAIFIINWGFNLGNLYLI